jgi:altronate dehydratase large subunit
LEEVGEETFQALLEALSGRITKGEAINYVSSMDIYVLGPVI